MSMNYLTLADRRLAYQRQVGKKNRPCLVFLPGFGSDMTGTKASFLADYCALKEISYVRFDYRGHGQSSGEFKSFTLGDWADDVLTVLDSLVEGATILVGSSMGGWLGLIAARKRPANLRALIGIAAAPDFTENMIVKRLTVEQKTLLETQGYIDDPGSPPDQCLPVTKHLIEEARQHLQLTSPIPIDCPVRLLQGMADAEVPWGHALHLAQTLTAQDVRVTLVKDGDHRLSRQQDLELLARTVDEFVA